MVSISEKKKNDAAKKFYTTGNSAKNVWTWSILTAKENMTSSVATCQDRKFLVDNELRCHSVREHQVGFAQRRMLIKPISVQVKNSCTI